MDNSKSKVVNLLSVEGVQLPSVFRALTADGSVKDEPYLKWPLVVSLTPKIWSSVGVCQCLKCDGFSIFGPYSLQKLKVGDRCVDKPCPHCESSSYRGNSCVVVAVFKEGV